MASSFYNFLLFCCRATANQVQNIHFRNIIGLLLVKGLQKLWVITSKNVERNRLKFFVGESDCDRLIKHKPWLNSGDQLQLSSEVENGFILDFDQLQRLQTTNLHYKSWVVLFLTSLLMIKSDTLNYLRISEKHLSGVNIEHRTKF